MTYPTPDEIRAAAEAIERDGAMAEITIALNKIVLQNPVLRRVAGRLANINTQAPGLQGSFDEARIISAIVTGLNYGLRIHEQRTRRKAGA
jgi:hypothetical protein